MKKGRFLWSAHRITEKQKAGKARNIKEKQLKNSRSTASKQPAARPSSASADFHLFHFKLPAFWAGSFLVYIHLTAAYPQPHSMPTFLFTRRSNPASFRSFSNRKNSAASGSICRMAINSFRFRAAGVGPSSLG